MRRIFPILVLLGAFACAPSGDPESILVSGRVCAGTELAEWTGELAHQRMALPCSAIAGAHVTLLSGEGEDDATSVTTDARGDFRVGPVRADRNSRARLVIHAAGYAGMSVSDIEPGWQGCSGFLAELPPKTCPKS